MKKIMYEDFPPISNAYSEDVRELVGELLHKDPAKRPSAKEVLQKKFIAVIIIMC